MAGGSVRGWHVQMPVPQVAPEQGKVRGLVVRAGVALLGRLLGEADAHTVAAMALREFSLIFRSREWRRALVIWWAVCAAVLAVPILYRSDIGRWTSPSGKEWLTGCGYALQIALALFMARWSAGRLRHDLYTDRLDELMLTKCSAADIAMGEALASAVASLWLVMASFPVCFFLAAMGGGGWSTAAMLALSLAPAGALGVWFGMGWALTFTFRRPSAALQPMTDWWVKAPGVPAWLIWGCVLALTPLSAVGVLIPGGVAFIARLLVVVQVVVQHVFWHWNPVLTVAGASGILRTTWATDWLVLALFTLFMMRTSMDAVDRALADLPEREHDRYRADLWIHHDVHYFTQYGFNADAEAKRREPAYYDAGNPIAAFDVALGHRVYLHPFLWLVAILGYLFCVGWSLLTPEMGKYTATFAVLLPATGALLLMSGGVAVSFAWEQDQHRWPSLAVLPMENHRIALGKVKGVVRPTLWLCFVGGLTALFMAWRGALEWQSALWMGLHVIVFPIALAGVSAVLALTRKNLEETIFWWAFLGAIPTLATILPAPIGGEGGWALPFSPPLLALLIVIEGPTAALVRGAWISFGLEVVGILGSLAVLGLYLREWTVGEHD
jgi:hypothetical protein